MTPRVALFLLCASLLLVLPACAQPLYHWGSYEDSLYTRYQTPGDDGRAEAFTMVEATIQEAEASERPVPPGVYADYGYLLFKEGRIDDSIQALKQEAELYPESRHLMETMISRIQARHQP